MVIPLLQFKVIYDVLTDSRNKLSQRDFVKAMSRLNIEQRRKRISADRTKKIPYGVVITWNIDNTVRDSLINEHFEEKDRKLIAR